MVSPKNFAAIIGREWISGPGKGDAGLAAKQEKPGLSPVRIAQISEQKMNRASFYELTQTAIWLNMRRTTLKIFKQPGRHNSIGVGV